MAKWKADSMAEAVKKFERNNEQVWRSAPQNVEAEQALLGAILVNNDAFYRVSDFLRAEHFFEPIHSRSTRSRPT